MLATPRGQTIDRIGRSSTSDNSRLKRARALPSPPSGSAAARVP